MANREEARGVAEGVDAARIGRDPSVVFREIDRRSGRSVYRS